MRYYQLFEKIHFKFPSPHAPGREVLIFKNPSNAEFKNLLAKSGDNEVRGITNGNVVYVWDANLALHEDVIDLLDKVVDVGKFIASDREVLSADEEKDTDYFLNHRMIQRMVGLK